MWKFQALPRAQERRRAAQPWVLRSHRSRSRYARDRYCRQTPTCVMTFAEFMHRNSGTPLVGAAKSANLERNRERTAPGKESTENRAPAQTHDRAAQSCASAAAFCATRHARTSCDANAVPDRSVQSMRVRFSGSVQRSSLNKFHVCAQTFLFEM
jgi:hypothetical protein